MDADLGWLALTLVPGVGARTFHRLIQRFGSPDRVFTARRSHLEQVPGLKKGSIDAIASRALIETAEKEMLRLRSLGIRMIQWGTEEYPPFLSNIADPPPLFFVKGKLLQEDER